MKDLYTHLDLEQVIAPVNVLDATVPTAVEVDLVDFNSAVIEVTHGAKEAGDAGTITMKLEHADDDGTGSAGDFTSVAAADMLGVTPADGIVLTLAGGAVAAAIHKFGYVGGKRFLKFTIAEADDNAAGTIMAVTVIKGHGLD